MVTIRQVMAGLLAVFVSIPISPPMVKAFPAAEGDVDMPVFGPSRVLRERIEQGDHVDVFASADMQQYRILARSRSETSAVMFTRNRLCVLGRAA